MNNMQDWTGMQQVQQNAILAHLKMIPWPSNHILPLEFKLKDFEKRTEIGNGIYTPPFYTHVNGYEMCIRVGMKRKYISVWAYLMAGVADENLKWPFWGDIKIELLNQAINSSTSHVHTFDFNAKNVSMSNQRVTSGRIARYGMIKKIFIFYDQLRYDSEEKTQYLKDDTLKFRISASTS